MPLDRDHDEERAHRIGRLVEQLGKRRRSEPQPNVPEPERFADQPGDPRARGGGEDIAADEMRQVARDAVARMRMADVSQARAARDDAADKSGRTSSNSRNRWPTTRGGGRKR
jgi:hypothetical protein